MRSIVGKLTDNINETKNSRFTKNAMPYKIVNIIAEELHLDKKMFELDPFQYEFNI